MSISGMLMNPDFQVGLLGAGAPRSAPTNLAGAFAQAVGTMQAAQAARSQQALEEAQMNQLQQTTAQQGQTFQQAQQNNQGLKDTLGPLQDQLEQGQIKPDDLNRQIAFALLNNGDPQGAVRILSSQATNKMYAPSNVEKELRLEGLDPNSPEGQARAKELSDAKTVGGQIQVVNARGTQQQASNYSKFQAQADEKKVDDQRVILQSAPVFQQQMSDLQNLVNSIPGWQLGATVGDASKKFSPQVQAFLSAANQGTLTLKQMLGFPSNNFSDSDLQFLSAIIGNPNTTKQAILQNIDRIKSQNQIGLQRASAMNTYYHQNNGSLKGFEESQPYYMTPYANKSVNAGASATPQGGASLSPQGASAMPGQGMLSAPETPGFGLLGQQPQQQPQGNDTQMAWGSF